MPFRLDRVLRRPPQPHRVVVVKNEGVKVQKGEAKSTKRRSRPFNGPFDFPIDRDLLPLQLRRPMTTWELCLRDVVRAAGVTFEKVEEVVQATSALAIEELKTKGVFIVPMFFKAMKRKAKSNNKRKETIVVVRVLRSFGGDVANQEGDC